MRPHPRFRSRSESSRAALPPSPGAADLATLLDGATLASLGDGELLARFVAGGDEAAFEGLVGRHGGMVLGVCRRLLGSGAGGFGADDAFQATWLVLVRRAGSVGRGDLLGPWLHAVAVRVCRRARARGLRRAVRERTGPPGEVALSVVSADPLPDPLAGAETRALIDEAIARLPERDRRLVVLADVEGLSRPEVADRLGWTPNMVRGRLARARTRLRADLARRGIAPVAAGASAAPLAVPFAWLAPPAAPLVAATTRAAALILTPTGRRLAATLAAGPAYSLAEGAARMLAWTSWKIVGTGLVAAGALAAGTATVALVPQAPAPAPAPAPGPSQTARPEPKPEPGAADPAAAQVPAPPVVAEGPSTNNAREPAVDLPPADAPLETLLKAKLETARRRYEAQDAFYNEGRVTIDRPIDAARQVMQAELALTNRPDRRRAAVQTLVDRVAAIVRRERQELVVGRATAADVTFAEDSLLDARITLAREGQAPAAPSVVDPLADPTAQVLPGDPALVVRLKQSLQAARNRYETQSAFHDEGRVTIDRLLDAAQQVTTAELALTSGADRRRAVVQALVDRINQLLTKERQGLAAGRATAADIAETEQVLLNAQAWLVVETPNPTPVPAPPPPLNPAPAPAPKVDSPRLAELRQARLAAARKILDETNRLYPAEVTVQKFVHEVQAWNEIGLAQAATPEARAAAIQAQIAVAQKGLTNAERLAAQGKKSISEVAREQIALLDAQIRAETGQSPPDTAATADLDRRLSDLERKVDRLLDAIAHRPQPEK